MSSWRAVGRRAGGERAHLFRGPPTGVNEAISAPASPPLLPLHLLNTHLKGEGRRGRRGGGSRKAGSPTLAAIGTIVAARRPKLINVWPSCCCHFASPRTDHLLPSPTLLPRPRHSRPCLPIPPPTHAFVPPPPNPPSSPTPIPQATQPRIGSSFPSNIYSKKNRMNSHRCRNFPKTNEERRLLTSNKAFLSRGGWEVEASMKGSGRSGRTGPDRARDSTRRHSDSELLAALAHN